jgi:hypothetical protein
MKCSGFIRSTCGLILAVYPASWRARYGAELDDALDQHRLTLSTVVDLALGAFDAQRHSELAISELTSSSGHLRSSFVSLLLAGVAFALAWAAVLSVRLRSSIGHANDLLVHVDIGREISFVQVVGALSLVAILAGAVLVAAATRRRGKQRGELALTFGVGLVVAAAFVWLVRMAGAGMENLADGGQFLLLAVLAWAVGTGCAVRMIGAQAPDPTFVGRGLALGRIGAIGLAVTLTGSVVLDLSVSLEAPSMRAEILALLPMALAVLWAARTIHRIPSATAATPADPMVAR